MAEPASKEDLDLIELALCRMQKDNPHAPIKDSLVSKLAQDEEGKQLLLRLLDQLNSLKAEREQKALPAMTENLRDSGSVVSDDEIMKLKEPIGDDEVTEKDVIREIRNVKKQNMFTHVALGIILVSGSLWRLSELLLALRIRNKITNPLKAIGAMLNGKSSHRPRLETPLLPPIDMPSVNDILDSNQFNGSNGHPLIDMPSVKF